MDCTIFTAIAATRLAIRLTAWPWLLKPLFALHRARLRREGQQ